MQIRLNKKQWNDVAKWWNDVGENGEAISLILDSKYSQFDRVKKETF